MADTCAGCPAELSPHIPGSAGGERPTRVCVSAVLQKLWLSSGEGSRTCVPRDRWSSWHRRWPRIAAVHGLEGECMQAEVMERFFFPEAPEEL